MITTKPSLKYETLDAKTEELIEKHGLRDLSMNNFSKIYDAIYEAIEIGYSEAVERCIDHLTKVFIEE